MEMLSQTKEALIRDYDFIVVGGGIAGVTCVETVSCFIEYPRLCHQSIFY